ncbi:MAG TPA: hypothetical protein EYG76_01000 [Methanothermococcus okinawensis]|uniref:DNA primase large subunit PriL n=1 Tax=Methanothermococcus okinawensis TaxID=155863 RepID=A0A833DPX7_9EURY|nr:hypothetical protein [Methanothermococcus okinawensis]
MLWDDLDKIKEYDFFKEINNNTNIKLIKYLLKYIFQGDNSYYELLNTVFKGEDRYLMDILINYLTLIIIANTKYHNLYIKKYAEKNLKSIVDILPNEVSIWEFINIGALSRNNDLHLERMDLNNGLVNIYPVKKIYGMELIRIRLKEMVEKIKSHNNEQLLKNDNVKEILNFIKTIVKFEDVGGIKSIGFKGEIPKEWHPPCIRGILEDILSGGSPSHYARRSFVAYWFCAKFNPNLRPIENGELINVSALEIAKEEEIEDFLDEVVKIFNTVGDFNVDRTKYYVSHNIGYRVANHITHCEYCKNWKEDGGKGLAYYCNPDDICKMRKDGKPIIIHPLDYLCYNINKNTNNQTPNNISYNKSKY